MAAVGTGVSLATTTNAATYTTGSFTPTEGDLLVVICGIPATVSTPTATASANGITFTRVIDEAWSGSAHTHAWFVADQLVPASPSSMTVTVDVTGDNGNGGNVVVLRVTGMSKVGTAAVKQATANSNVVGTGGTYTLTFGAATDTNNPIILALSNNTNPATMTPPSGFTELYDIGFSSPTNGLEVNKVDSGQTSDNYTWGDTSSTVGTANGLELDASASAVNYNGTASSSATVSVAASGAVAVSGSATSASTVSVAASGVVAASATATVSGTSAVAASGTVGKVASASLAATGSITASGSVGGGTLNGTVTLAATASVTATGVVARTATASIAATSAVSASGVKATTATSTLAATGSITATGGGAVESTATVVGTASIAAAGVVAKTATATVATTATITAAGVVALTGTATLAATVAATTDATLGLNGQATVATTGTIAAVTHTDPLGRVVGGAPEAVWSGASAEPQWGGGSPGQRWGGGPAFQDIGGGA